MKINKLKKYMENQNLNQVAEMPEPQCLSSEVKYRKPNREILKNYQINIEFLDRGCLVRVGCKSIAFESVEQAMVEINKYVSNPYEMDEHWRKILDA